MAATWAAGQAAERNQWALELWRVAEERRAALVALQQSKETLRQVWRQLRPPWPAPTTTCPPNNLRSGTAAGSATRGNGADRHPGHCKQAGERVATTLRERWAPRADTLPAGPPVEGEVGHLGEQWGSRGGHSCRVSKSRGREEGEGETSRRRPPLPAGGEQWPGEVPAPVPTPGLGRHGEAGRNGLEGWGGPRREGPCQLGNPKLEEAEGRALPQAGEPGGPPRIKQEEEETSPAECQEI